MQTSGIVVTVMRLAIYGVKTVYNDNDYDDDICVAELLQNGFIFIKTKVK